MIPWEQLDMADVPGSGDTLTLHRHGRDYSIRVNGLELMNSRMHGSEEALAELACEGLEPVSDARVLIGGLGMGFTVAAALKRLGPDSRVVVAEIVPAVVTWNRGVLYDLAGRPLEDPRVEVRENDVARVMNEARREYDAILLDVDNGPDGLTREGNDALYTAAGLERARKALRPGGVLAVWSAGPDESFTKRFKKAGFAVRETRVRARAGNKGGHHTIWLGRVGRNT